jgi:lipoprotein-anchoring transpeptidase ErfK/SrfK
MPLHAALAVFPHTPVSLTIGNLQAGILPMLNSAKAALLGFTLSASLVAPALAGDHWWEHRRPQAPFWARPVSPVQYGAPMRAQSDPRFMRQTVAYDTNEAPGTIVVDTEDHFLYLVLGGGQAMRYGIGTAKSGFEWNGVHHLTNKREWPDWTPPKEMLARRPDIPTHMDGGVNNPLGARALYIGSTLYRIHGTNEPWTIGHDVSSGCIRMVNADVIDLYGRVKIGAKVIVS